MSRKRKDGQANPKRPRQSNNGGKPRNPFDTGANSDRPSSSSSSESSENERETDPLPAGTTEYATRINRHLESAGIRPPKWPSDPGNPKNMAAMDAFRQSYKRFNDRARASLMKAGLIDDPDKPKRLQDAIDFKGICEDMCSDFEKITRITEHDTKAMEKDPSSGWPIPAKLVKKMARSAAGQEAPLPMEVRSTACLRRTVDYLVDSLLRIDSNLPVMHTFLWDRTRAIRRDFVFHSTMSSEEMLDQIYCLENITRFHVTSLHLMSQKDFAPDSFSEQQEIEQLSKALLSLIIAYDDCKAQGVACKNEAEFRAYHLLLNAYQPNILETVQSEWDSRFWRESDDIRTAVSLAEALKDTQEFHGPMSRAPSLAAWSSFHTYFRIVDDPKLSYTMACFAEIHFGQLRRSILQSIRKGLRRPKGNAKDVTPEVINRFLYFDREDEAIDFVEQHGMDFIHEGGIHYLDATKMISYPRLKHTFSRRLVEKKRGSRSLPEVLHNTVFQDPSQVTADTDGDSLFVPGSGAAKASFKQVRFASATGAQSGLDAAQRSSSFQPALPAAQGGPSKVNPFAAAAKAETTQWNGFGNQASGFSTENPFQKRPVTEAPGFSNPFAAAGTKPGESISAKPATSSSAPMALPAPTTTKLNPFANPFAPSAKAAEGSLPPSTVEPATAPTIKVTPPKSASSLAQGEDWKATQSASGFDPRMDALKDVPAKKDSPFAFLSGASSLPAPSREASTNGAHPAPPKFPSFGMTSGSNAPTFAPVQMGATAGPPKPPTFVAEQPSFAPSPLPKTGTPALGPSVHQLPPPLGNVTPQLPVTKSLQPSPASLPAFKPTPLPPPPEPKRDLLGDFARWFVTGDNGLLEEFEIFAVEEIVKKSYEQYEEEMEEERIRAQEKLDSETADQFRVNSLSNKYFKRWRRNVREIQQSRLRRVGREKLREYWESKRTATLAAQERAEELQRSTLKRSRHASGESTNSLDTVEQFRQLLKQREDLSKAEADLLATGVLAGVSDERNAVSKIIRNLDHGSVRNERSSTPDARKLAKLNSDFSKSTSAIKAGGGKTQALREELSDSTLRRSTSSFRSHSRTPSEASAKRVSKVSNRWQLKAMGLVMMPNGTALPESIAYPMKYEGKRYAGLGSFGLPPDSRTARRVSASSADFGSSFSSSRLGRSLERMELSSRQQSNASSPVAKRKRTPEEEIIDLGANLNDPPRKRVASNESDTAKVIEDMRAARREMEEGADWFREQNAVITNELLSRGHTPWEEE